MTKILFLYAWDDACIPEFINENRGKLVSDIISDISGYEEKFKNIDFTTDEYLVDSSLIELLRSEEMLVNGVDKAFYIETDIIE